jgi:hypothetical protein
VSVLERFLVKDGDLPFLRETLMKAQIPFDSPLFRGTRDQRAKKDKRLGNLPTVLGKPPGRGLFRALRRKNPRRWARPFPTECADDI